MKLLPILLLVTICYSASAQNFRLQRIMYYSSIDNSSLTAKKEFYYPGNRGSDYKNGIINYDSAVYFYATNRPYTVFTKTYDTADRLLTDKSADVYLPSPYYKTTGHTYEYDSLGRIVEESHAYSEHKHYPTYTTIQKKYDSSGNPIETNTTSYSIYNPPWPPVKTKYLYDTANNNTRIVQQIMDTVNSVYFNAVKDSFIYNNSNQWEQQIRYVWRDSAWQLYAKYEMDYKGGQKASEWLSYTYDTAGKTFLPRVKKTMKYNNLWDTTEVSLAYNINNGFKTRSMKLTVYNSYNQPDTVYHYKSNYSSSNPDTKLYFQNKEVHIYQVYWPTNVSNTTDLENKLKIYPVPANNTLNLTAEIKELQDVTISISDIQGRVLYTHQELSSLSINKKIPVSKLPNGIYILKLSGHNLNLTRKFSIAR